MAADSSLFIGLISGTSADGVDAAVIDWQPAPPQAQLLGFLTLPYPEPLRRRLLHPAALTLAEMTRLNFELAEHFAGAARQVAEVAGIALGSIHAIGSHGQTVCHLPPRRPGELGVTLQLGEPCVIAERTGVTTIGEFRYRDMAAGGQGAPLTPFVDWLLLTHPHRARFILNIGGIANGTLLASGAGLDDVLAGDTGPGNMVVDGLVERLTGGAESCDRDGGRAAGGAVNELLLQEWLCHPFFDRPAPRSTGREDFGAAFIDGCLEQSRRLGLTDGDILATATALTAEAVRRSFDEMRELAGIGGEVECYVSGGGAHNVTLVRMIGERLGAPLRPTDHLGLPVDAKEAIVFAVLAACLLEGRPANAPSVTGATGPRLLGKIAPA